MPESEGLSFWKMHGSGNDFILIDNRGLIFPEKGRSQLISKLCRRGVGIGADGLILIEDSPVADFLWHFYNADGSEAEMCGNGGRCAALFALRNGIAGNEMTFQTRAGLIRARVGQTQIRLEMTAPGGLRQGIKLEFAGGESESESGFEVESEVESEVVDFIDSGVPHTVIMVDQGLDLVALGERGTRIRYHQEFMPAGTNVNFVKLVNEQCLLIRTYERGVEGETLACGTGAVAAALLAFERGLVKSPTEVITQSGESLKVYYKKEDSLFKEVFLEGGAVIVYRGVLESDLYLVRDRKPPISSIAALGSNFNPRNT